MRGVSAPRRAPVFRRFIVTGAVVGAVLGILTSMVTKGAPDYGTFAGVGYFGLIGAFLGALAGAIVAIVLDGRLRRRQDG